MARSNNGAPGIDGVTFEAIDKSGPEGFLKQIREELVSHTYRPMRVRTKEIPKDGGKVRVLSIPAIRDVKCVVADAERMFDSSANLTEQALRLNMALESSL